MNSYYISAPTFTAYLHVHPKKDCIGIRATINIYIKGVPDRIRIRYRIGDSAYLKDELVKTIKTLLKTTNRKLEILR